MSELIENLTYLIIGPFCFFFVAWLFEDCNLFRSLTKGFIPPYWLYVIISVVICIGVEFLHFYVKIAIVFLAIGILIGKKMQKDKQEREKRSKQ